VNPCRAAKQIDVEAIGLTTSAHLDSRYAKRASTALSELAGHPPAKLRSAQRDPRDAIVEREHIVEAADGDRAFEEIRPQTNRGIVDRRHVRPIHGSADGLREKISQRRSESAGAAR